MNSVTMQSVIDRINFMHSYSVLPVETSTADKHNDCVSGNDQMVGSKVIEKVEVITLNTNDIATETTVKIAENSENDPSASIFLCPVEQRISEDLGGSEKYCSDIVGSDCENRNLENCEVITLGNSVLPKGDYCDESSQKENYAENADEKVIRDGAVSIGRDVIPSNFQEENGMEELSEERKRDYVTDYENTELSSIMTSDTDSPEHEGPSIGLNVKFTCDVCSKAFRKKSNLKRHYRIHTGDNPHACKDCPARFPTLSRLNEHRHVHSWERPFACKVCCKSFARMSNLTRHYHTHEDKTYQCSICLVRFCDENRLREHSLTHDGDKKFQCNMCNKKFLKKYNLSRHSQVHAGNLHHRCKACGECFVKRLDLLLHRLEHAKKKEMTFQKVVMERQRNLGKQDSTDSEAERTDSNVDDWDDDDQETDSADETEDMLSNCPFTCDKCDTQFVNKNDLIEHAQQHTEVQCSVCKATFDDVGLLNNHFLVHSEERHIQCNFTCEQCDVQFANENDLIEHVQQHMVMQCSICSVTCNDVSLLNNHLVMHSAEKHFQCDVSGRVFEGNSDLHLQTHSQQHLCDLCQMQFNQLEGLNAHYLIHHGIKPFKCDVCGRLFHSQVLFQSHYLEHRPLSNDKIPVDDPFAQDREELVNSHKQWDDQLPMTEELNEQLPLKEQPSDQLAMKNQPGSRLANLIQSLEARLREEKIPLESIPVTPPKKLLAETKSDSEPPRSLTMLINDLEARLNEPKTEFWSQKKQINKYTNGSISSEKPVRKFRKKTPLSSPKSIKSVRSFHISSTKNKARSNPSSRRRKSSVYCDE